MPSIYYIIAFVFAGSILGRAQNCDPEIKTRGQELDVQLTEPRRCPSFQCFFFFFKVTFVLLGNSEVEFIPFR